jgi:hypothetical protein
MGTFSPTLVRAKHAPYEPPALLAAALFSQSSKSATIV